MAKLVKVVGICDSCGSDYDPESAGTSFTIQNDAEPKSLRKVDFCSTCSVAFGNMIAGGRVEKAPKLAVTRSLSAATAEAEDNKPSQKCPVAGCDYASQDGRGVSAHMRAKHPEVRKTAARTRKAKVRA